MTATTSYQAGVESNDVILSYAQEVAYGVLPAVAFQAIRLTGETLAGSKTRSRPGEILVTGEVAAAVTQQEQAAGNINFALSYATYDDFLSGAIDADWSSAVVVTGAAGDIVAGVGTGSSPRTFTSATAGKFTGLNVGNFIRIAGFAQSALNGLFRVAANTGTSLTVANVPVSTTAETPAGAAAVMKTGGYLLNARTFKSFTIQKQLSPTLYLRYLGSFVTGFTISGGVGQFLSGNFTVMAASETSATTNASTGGVVAAPTGRVHDTVGGFNGVYLDGVPITAVVDSFDVTLSASGAKQEFGIGSATAQGQIMGLNDIKGTLKVYFRDLSLYARFKAETQGAISFVTRDPTGAGYAITLPAATIMNPNVTASGPSTGVMASFALEGNPQAGGGTIIIDRLPL